MSLWLDLLLEHYRQKDTNKVWFLQMFMPHGTVINVRSLLLHFATIFQSLCHMMIWEQIQLIRKLCYLQSLFREFISYSYTLSENFEYPTRNTFGELQFDKEMLNHQGESLATRLHRQVLIESLTVSTVMQDSPWCSIKFSESVRSSRRVTLVTLVLYVHLFQHCFWECTILEKDSIKLGL